MKYHLVLSCFAAISALLFTTAYSVNIKPFYNVDETRTVYIEKKKFELKCNVTDNPQKLELIWQREGKTLTTEFKGRNKTEVVKGTMHILRVTDSSEKDIGNYSCQVGDMAAEFQVVTKFFVKVDDNINVVEGDPLRIKCDTRGTPPPQLSWKYENETYNNTYDSSDDRIILLEYKGIKNGELMINSTAKYDRGTYTCIGRPAGADDDVSDDDIEKSACMVRVKDQYAALWPFLGICAEVFVLCLIIFIYEKKRNKTELEESDTDQSPDQKNTPDHGKESNLRHRQ